VEAFLHNSCEKVLFYFILLQMGEPLYSHVVRWTLVKESFSLLIYLLI